MNATLSEFIPIFLIFLGTLFNLLSTIGLIRFSDVYNRAHALSKSSTLGVLFTLIGTLFFFLFQEGYFSIRLLLGIFFVFLTTPVAAHMIIRSAHRSGVELSKESVEDELANDIEKRWG